MECQVLLMTWISECRTKLHNMNSSDKKIFATIFFSIFTSVTGVGIVVPLLPVYAHDLGASGLYISLIFVTSVTDKCRKALFEEEYTVSSETSANIAIVSNEADNRVF